MGYYNQPPTHYPEELNEFEKVLRSLPINGSIEALDLLETLVRNVIQHPKEEKYRRIRSTNEKLAPLFSLPGIMNVLSVMGWHQEGEFMLLPQSVNLDFQKHTVKILEAKSHYGKERCQGVARVAKKNTPDPDKVAILQQLEPDSRERSAAKDSPIPSEPIREDGPVPPASTRPKSAFDFERRTDLEAQQKEKELSLQELRALQKKKYKEFEADPHARQSEAYQRPPSVANGAAEAGWFDWLWGSGSSSSAGGGGGGGGGGGRGDPPAGPRMKTMRDLPAPVRRGGG